jgi:Hint module
VVRQERQTVPDLGGPTVPDAGRVCTKSGEKCAGVPGQAAVKFAKCCDDRLSCGVPKSLPSGEWGQYCISKSEVDTAATTKANAGASSAPVTTVAGGSTVAQGSTVAGGSTVASGTGDASATTGEGASATTGPTLAPGETSTTKKSEKPIGGAAGGTTSSPDPTPEATESAKSDNGSACFPAYASVELESGETIRMDQVSIGDVVKVGVNEYSRVFLFTHKMSETVNKFVTLKTESGASLALTEGHYLYVNGALVAASTVNVGDMLTLGNGETSGVVAVGSVNGVGLFNPQTVNGNIVVDGVLSSTYTTAVQPSFAHAILAPFRMFSTFGFSLTALESGGGLLADIAPRGQAVF